MCDQYYPHPPSRTFFHILFVSVGIFGAAAVVAVTAIIAMLWKLVAKYAEPGGVPSASTESANADGMVTIDYLRPREKADVSWILEAG